MRSDVDVVGETELLVALEPKKLEYRSQQGRAHNWQPGDTFTVSLNASDVGIDCEAT